MPSKIEQTCMNCKHYFKPYSDLGFGECPKQIDTRNQPALAHDNDACPVDAFEERST